MDISIPVLLTKLSFLYTYNIRQHSKTKKPNRQITTEPKGRRRSLLIAVSKKEKQHHASGQHQDDLSPNP